VGSRMLARFGCGSPLRRCEGDVKAEI
jgi:hypothetical protein